MLPPLLKGARPASVDKAQAESHTQAEAAPAPAPVREEAPGSTTLAPESSTIAS